MRKIGGVCAIILVLALFAGCVEETPDDGDVVESKLSYTQIKISDKPTEDFDHIYVTFSQVKLLNSTTKEWEIITLTNTTVDLIYLHKNNISEELGIDNITAGNYSKLRIIIDNVTGVLNSTGETVYIDVPSDTLEIQHFFNLLEGKNSIEVEIDLDKSIVQQGEKYKMVPIVGEIRIQYQYKNQEGYTHRIRNTELLNQKTQNRPPVVYAMANDDHGKPITAAVGENITFNASETIDIEGDNLTYLWDFGDGNTSTEIIVNYNYSSPGTYTVILQVSDGVDTATEEIRVTITGSSGNGGNNGGNNGQG